MPGFVGVCLLAGCLSFCLPSTALWWQFIEKPVTVEIIVEKIIEVPVKHIVEVPVEQIVEKIVQVCPTALFALFHSPHF